MWLSFGKFLDMVQKGRLDNGKKGLKMNKKKREIEWGINTETGKCGMLHVLFLSLDACTSLIKPQ